jgi:peptidoglycan/LPS O-acetylase OafA/YrhL
LATLSTFLTTVVLAWLKYNSLFAIRYSISVAVICAALSWHGNLDPVSKKLALLTYGVYLMHPMVVTFLGQLGIATGYPWVLLLLVVTISLATTFILQKTPMRQFV